MNLNSIVLMYLGGAAVLYVWERGFMPDSTPASYYAKRYALWPISSMDTHSKYDGDSGGVVFLPVMVGGLYASYLLSKNFKVV